MVGDLTEETEEIQVFLLQAIAVETLNMTRIFFGASPKCSDPCQNHARK